MRADPDKSSGIEHDGDQRWRRRNEALDGGGGEICAHSGSLMRRSSRRRRFEISQELLLFWQLGEGGSGEPKPGFLGMQGLREHFSWWESTWHIVDRCNILAVTMPSAERRRIPAVLRYLSAGSTRRYARTGGSGWRMGVTGGSGRC